MSQALASLSIDLDGIRHYRAIHGLPPRSGPDPFLSEGLDRFLHLCDSFAIPATLFVVTEDLEDPCKHTHVCVCVAYTNNAHGYVCFLRTPQ